MYIYIYIYTYTYMGVPREDLGHLVMNDNHHIIIIIIVIMIISLIIVVIIVMIAISITIVIEDFFDFFSRLWELVEATLPTGSAKAAPRHTDDCNLG